MIYRIQLTNLSLAWIVVDFLVCCSPEIFPQGGEAQQWRRKRCWDHDQVLGMTGQLTYLTDKNHVKITKNCVTKALILNLSNSSSLSDSASMPVSTLAKTTTCRRWTSRAKSWTRWRSTWTSTRRSRTGNRPDRDLLLIFTKCTVDLSLLFPPSSF